MKKTIALVMGLIMLFMAFGALAEGQEPMYATIGDALAAAGENPVAGGGDDYYAVVTEKDGTYYRSVADTDDEYRALQDAVWEAAPDQMEAAFAAADEYVKTLPVAYTEAFTAVPMAQADLDALVGKTLGELREAGFTDSESGTEGDGIVYVLRSGLFDYAFTVDADFDAYVKAQEDGTDGDFAVKGAALRGITREACFKDLHADGTVEEMPDPFEGYAELLGEVTAMIEQVKNGGDVDIDGFFNDLKERYPDLEDTVDMYLEMYKMLGAEALAAMMTTED